MCQHAKHNNKQIGERMLKYHTPSLVMQYPLSCMTKESSDKRPTYLVFTRNCFCIKLGQKGAIWGDLEVFHISLRAQV